MFLLLFFAALFLKYLVRSLYKEKEKKEEENGPDNLAPFCVLDKRVKKRTEHNAYYFFLLVVLQQQQNNDKYQTLSWVISLITRLVCLLLLLSRFLLFLQGRHFVWQNILLHDECENIFYQFKRTKYSLCCCSVIQFFMSIKQRFVCLFLNHCSKQVIVQTFYNLSHC